MASTQGEQVFCGEQRSLITTNATLQAKATSGRAVRLLVFGVGTAWVLDIYDHASANTNPVWQWVSADGKVSTVLDIPMTLGVRIVSSGTTPGSAVLVWS